MPSYAVSSTRLGSTSTIRTSSGVARTMTEVIRQLMQDDLPEPVAPATSTCGIFARLADHVAALDVLAEPDEHRVVVPGRVGQPQHVARG